MSKQTIKSDNLPLIKVVGISAGGKSTLVRALRQRGYHARPVSQEHSNVPDLWQQFERPRVLIYLYADLETQRERRPDVTWDKGWLREEESRLYHASGYADLKINTSGLQSEDVLRIALTFLETEQIRHAENALPQLSGTGSALRPAEDAPEGVTGERAELSPEELRNLSRSERRKLRRQRRKER